MIVDEIFGMQLKYEKKYGSKVVILSQIGGFMEVYGVDNDEEKIGNVTCVAELLNIVKTKKDKKNPANDRRNPELCGFPVASLQRCLGVLVAANFTVIVMEQTKVEEREGRSPLVTREITRVVSPGTYVDEGTDTYQSNHLVCFAIKKEKQPKGSSILRLACSSFDLSTGRSSAYEVLDYQVDKSFALAEGVRMIKSLNPREVILYGDVTNELENKLELGDRVVHTIETQKGEESVKWMNETLQLYYPNHGQLTPIEYLDLENRILACVAFVQLIKFVKDHNANALRNLQAPKLLNDSDHLCLENNAIQQLNVLPVGTVVTRATPNSIHSLMDVVGYCKTPMGHRRLRERLCRPLCNAQEIKRRHDQVEAMLINDVQEDVQSKLKNVGDLERLIQKLCTQKMERGIACPDLLKVWSGAEAALDCSKILQSFEPGNALNGLIGARHETFSKIRDMLDEMQRTFDRNALDNADAAMEGGIFAKEYDLELTKLFETVKIDRKILETYRKNFNDAIFPLIKTKAGEDIDRSTIVRLESCEKDKGIYSLVTTEKRALLLKTCLPLTIWRRQVTTDVTDLNKDGHEDAATNEDMFPMDIEDEVVHTDEVPSLIEEVSEEVTKDCLSIISSKTCAKLTTPAFRQAAENYKVSLDAAKQETQQQFVRFCVNFQNKYSDALKILCETVIQIDLCACAAQAAVKRRHCRPTVDETTGSSYIIAENFRHAIIESLQTGVSYVPCSITLGQNAPEDVTNGSKNELTSTVKDKMDGMLLYGCNSAGKSSLMKSVGLSVILAQAGFYVPCSRFAFRPFTSVMTRILSNDDIFKGQSSFATEILELSGILKRCNDKSLVLGDEIANSTESTSGLAIVATAIERLAKTRGKFIFATHLHELAKMDFINKLNHVKHYHLEITYDSSRDILVYNRQLQPGSGDAVYGLEIAKAMGMDAEFLATAHMLRREILGTDAEMVSSRSSRYNSTVFLKPCQVCGGKSSDVHHIKEQATADSDGYVGTIHKNNLSNLVVLCKSCHDKVHVTKTLHIIGYVATTQGRILDFDDKTQIVNDKYSSRDKVKYRVKPKTSVAIPAPRNAADEISIASPIIF